MKRLRGMVRVTHMDRVRDVEVRRRAGMEKELENR